MKVVIERDRLECLLRDLDPNLIMAHLEEHGYILQDSEVPDEEPQLLFNKLYTAFRRKVFRVRVKPYVPNTRAWKLLEPIVEEAMVFSKEFGLEYREGFIKFFEVANELNILHLSKLVRNKHKISLHYNNEFEIESDPNKSYTDYLYKAFFEEVALRYGVYKEWDSPESFVLFVRASKLLNKTGVQPREAVKRAADFWDWTNTPLTPDKLNNKKFIDLVSTDLKPVQVETKKVKIKKGADRWQ